MPNKEVIRGRRNEERERAVVIIMIMIIIIIIIIIVMIINRNLLQAFIYCLFSAFFYCNAILVRS